MTDQNVKISGHTQEFVASLVEAGVHKDADAVVKDALDRYEQEYATKLERLRSAVQAGFADADAGNSIGLTTQADRDTYWADLDRRVSENVAARAVKVG